MSTPTSESMTWHRFTRRTVGGRNILYNLAILQQPLHARACGSGPKSSADRRPVDPPPILSLNIYEGESFDNCKDITFDYNADFFLYVSLENARPMAHGRVQTPAATSPPVLTGSPVSSCCFLDRPDPAGYFLFPDLSVRHEGRYKLVFNLFEQIKDPADADATPKDASEADDREGYEHRHTIYSDPFTVFSAKKFPGLSTSTELSRCIAEQGCRVRIRRDVRMRRREPPKGANGGDFDKREDEFMRQGRTHSPSNAFRARSASNSSVDRSSFTPGMHRRASGMEYGPPPPPQPAMSGGALQFGQGAGSYNRFQAPQTAGSTPASPVYSSYSHGSQTHAPPTPSRYGPSNTSYPGTPVTAQDESRRSTVFGGSSFGGPTLLPRPSPTARPTVETRNVLASLSSTTLSPMASPASASPTQSSLRLPSARSIKRPHDGKRDPNDDLLEYHRSSGLGVSRRSFLMAYPGYYGKDRNSKSSYYGAEQQGNSKSTFAIHPSLAASILGSDDEHDYLSNGLNAATMSAANAVEHARKRRFRGHS